MQKLAGMDYALSSVHARRLLRRIMTKLDRLWSIVQDLEEFQAPILMAGGTVPTKMIEIRQRLRKLAERGEQEARGASDAVAQLEGYFPLSVKYAQLRENMGRHVGIRSILGADPEPFLGLVSVLGGEPLMCDGPDCEGCNESNKPGCVGRDPGNV
jgi:hypothetical protein